MKIAFTSDTHGMRPNLPETDVLIHCGDICPRGGETDFLAQLHWLESIAPNYPLGIYLNPGNHDCIIETDPAWSKDEAARRGVRLLIHEPVTIEGIKFFFSPFTPTFYDWAFMKDDPDLAEVWATIPDDTEVLITHGPAKHFLDWCPNGNVGSRTLGIRTYQLASLKAHAFGHVHESYGTKRVDDKFWAINASALDGSYRGFNPTLVLDTDTWDVDSP